jgi:hypothetical protein
MSNSQSSRESRDLGGSKDPRESKDPRGSKNNFGKDKSLIKSPLIIFSIVNTGLVLLAIIIYLLVLFLYLSKDWVESKHCVSPIGEFTVEPSVDVGNVLLSCSDAGYDDKKTCIYNSVPSLLQATRICNQHADICSRFVYNANSQKMKIVSLQGTPNRGSQDDNTYTRQSGVTFKGSGNNAGNTSPALADTVTANADEVVPITVTNSSIITGL